MPALPSCLIDPIWDQFAALLPERMVQHPLGCHRSRVPDRVVFDKLVQVLVFGAAYGRIPEKGCSATTLRRRRDEWIGLGVMERLRRLVLTAYDRLIGLDLAHLSLDGCLTKAPCGGEVAGRSPVDRGKQGLKRSSLVEGAGIPLGALTAPANCHDSPLLAPTLDTLAVLGPLPDDPHLHLDRGYDSTKTRDELADVGSPGSSPRRASPPRSRSAGAVVERTNAWQNAFKKLLWCTERRQRVVDFYLAFANVVITVRRLLRTAWSRYRWDSRPVRRP